MIIISSSSLGKILTYLPSVLGLSIPRDLAFPLILRTMGR
jgi:hypothetical protein